MNVVLFLILISTHVVYSEDVCNTINCGSGICIATRNPALPYYCQCPNGSNTILACPSENPCSRNPCGQGICEVVPNLLYGYLCRCADDTISLSNCNVTTSSCDSNPCTNGLCIEGLTSFICNCLPTWTGRSCNEKIVSPCSNNPCNPGRCFQMNDPSLPYVCLCPNAQFAMSCQTYPSITDRMLSTTIPSPYTCNPLDPTNCMHSGQCLPIRNDYRCLCTSGYTGRFCETRIDECASNPCLYDGICYNFQSSYICGCPDGSFRSQCLPKADSEFHYSKEVLTSTARIFVCPCLNGGVCTIISSQTCICPNGFTGHFCENLLPGNSCQQTQCGNGGTCHEKSTGSSVSAYCQCKNGYTGKFCEIEYFRCRSNGRFNDPYNCVKGKYFECIYYEEDVESNSNGLLLSRDCPASLRFNTLSDQCDYSENVQCVYP